MENYEEPPPTLSDPHELLLAHLDFYRATVLRKLDGLSEDELRRSRLPSGWTPLELLKHLAYMERRWLVWGFAGEAVDDPWGDEDPATGRWHVRPGEPVEGVRAVFDQQGRRSRAIASGADLLDTSAAGGRFVPPEDGPTLSWILFHILQEYARHVGHLDVARELADGAVGE